MICSARAKSILLTHFSARYPKLLQEQADMALAAGNCGIAFDNLHMRLGDTWKMKHYYQAIVQSYADAPDGKEEGEAI